MVRTLLASSSSSSDTATASRDSTASSNSSYDLSLDSARPSSATDDEDFKKPTFHSSNKKSKYFSFSKLSSVFLRKDPRTPLENSSSSSKKITSSAKEVIRKYVKKVKPLYEKFTPKQSKMAASSSSDRPLMVRNSPADCNAPIRRYGKRENCSNSFSGNLRYPRMRSCTVSCPSSMRSSPTHSGVLRGGRGVYASSSSMEELQSAIEGVPFDKDVCGSPGYAQLRAPEEGLMFSLQGRSSHSCRSKGLDEIAMMITNDPPNSSSAIGVIKRPINV
ncbi:hypothetical protein MRB53_031220 [Persea americana]|uniref:Uncharacterized protein n=1 Tax=Persea americana TaxID=3435 RepID=A0ACC2KND2_PERAE|nr:hypothetical protein MRB53_031220 [Persea americana]